MRIPESKSEQHLDGRVGQQQGETRAFVAVVPMTEICGRRLPVPSADQGVHHGTQLGGGHIGVVLGCRGRVDRSNSASGRVVGQ